MAGEIWSITSAYLTKEQRDEHIRRYAEVLEARAAIVVHNEPVPKRGPGQPKGIARQIADETGLSKSTVRRALNPPVKADPPKEVFDVHEMARRRLMGAKAL